MSNLSRSAAIETPAERVFTYIGDIRNLVRHMSESRSMPMMGSKLGLEIMTPEATGVGADYRYSGRMMGLTIDFSDTVTAHVAGHEYAHWALLLLLRRQCPFRWYRSPLQPRAVDRRAYRYSDRPLITCWY
jgi:hypothetical protein